MRDSVSQSPAGILLVDDRQSNLLALEAILTDLKQDLVTATSGEQALRCVLERDFAVILLDVHMQGLDGLETAQFIRSRQRSRHTPIIFLTAEESPLALINRAYQLGAVDFLIKPLVPAILRAKVAVFVDLFRKSEEIQRQARQLVQMEEREYQRRLAEESLRQSEERFRLIADSAPVLLWMAGPDGQCSFVNKPWLEFTGQSLEHEMGEGWSNGVMPDDQPRCLEIYRTAVRERKAFSMQFRFRRADGEFRWVHDTGKPRFDPDGQFVGFIGSAVDITEHKRVEEQLLQAQKMEAIGRLAGGIAHDFNNLMTVVLGYSELLLDNPSTSEQSSTCVEAIQAAGSRAAALTRQLLAFSRKQMLAPRALNVNDVIKGMQGMLHRLIPENIEVSLDLGPEAPLIQADPIQIEQVILNLVVNAKDAMPKGGKLRISTRAHEPCNEPVIEMPSGPCAELIVRDTGCGMDAQTQAHLFEPFFTTKDLGKGTGLGMATVYGIVKQSGGSISVWSEPGRGTEIRILMPCAKSAAEPSASREVPASPLGGSECVLLVEDEESIRGLARRVLRQGGYTVLEACNGAHAVELSRRHPGAIHILITDVIMPGMSGRDLASQLCRQRPDLKVLFISGYHAESLSPQAGMGLLQKPFLPSALLTEVRQILDRHEDQEAAARPGLLKG